MGETKPRKRFPEGFKPDPSMLAGGRYGTMEMAQIWGPERTFEYSLMAQAEAARTLSKLYPEAVPPEAAAEIVEKATTRVIDPNRIRELEEQTGHDVIAINSALEEKLSSNARPHVNKARTSADTTETARALQLRDSLGIIAGSVENLRDILLEKSLDWATVPHMDCTHQYDALPSVAGRPFSHYAEMLQSGLDFLAYVHEKSMVGKWGDATGNHHSANALCMNGIRIQEDYCRGLGLRWMDAAAQTPGLEFQADVVYLLARLGATVNNVAKFIAWGRSDDVNIFVNNSPKRKKGSSAMPHKDAKNGNPTTEEQSMSMHRYLVGNLMTAMMNCEFPYARDLSASANSRINFEDGFKFADHSIRSLANTAYWLALREERCIERVLRSCGCVTSQEVMNVLTDLREVNDPMARGEAHDLLGRLATEAYTNKIPFFDIVSQCDAVTRRIPVDRLREITDPLKYIGDSTRIVQKVYNKYYGRKTLPEVAGSA